MQEVEYKCDTGYGHIGISVCSEKRELVNMQFDTLPDEKKRHDACRKYRRSRRNRLRYRKPRFDNRVGNVHKAEKEGRKWFPPSIRHKEEIHIDLYEQISEVVPVTRAVFEMGQFDTQALKAAEKGQPVPTGEEYQHGERYGFATLREAVFFRDDYTCVCCGKSAIKDGVILHVHHLGFRNGDHTDRMDNLATVCEKCHTAKNHKPGGKLWGLQPKLKPLKEAAFMNAVRYDLFMRLKNAHPDVEFHMTWGAMTKLKRSDLSLPKTHANDAYSMGDFHPKHRTDFVHYTKRRRNNRVLSKFYDAKYYDSRDGSVKSGTQLSCGRTNRREPRMSEKNEWIFRGKKKSKGRVSIRRKRYSIQPGDIVIFDGQKYTAKGAQHYGMYTTLDKHPPVRTDQLACRKHICGWIQVT